MIVYSPMGSGLLSGGMTRERIESLPEDDWRKHDARFHEPQLSRNLDLVERLRAVAERHDTARARSRSPGRCATRRSTARSSGFRPPDQVDPVIARREPRAHRRGHQPRSKERSDRCRAVGFVGLGAHGRQHRRRAARRRLQLYGTDRTETHAQPLLEQGLRWRDTPREVAEAADFVFTSVTDDEASSRSPPGPTESSPGWTRGRSGST